MNTDIKNYETSPFEIHNDCQGCCFEDDGDCYLLHHDALNDALLERDGVCFNRSIYKQIEQ